jgi:hypothetical protein
MRIASDQAGISEAKSNRPSSPMFSNVFTDCDFMLVVRDIRHEAIGVVRLHWLVSGEKNVLGGHSEYPIDLEGLT